MVTSEVVAEMVTRIREAVRPDKIILFGSRARREARPDSDFDLLIVAPSALPRWQRTPPLYRLLAGLGVPKDIVWWTPEEVEEWRGAKSHFINTAMREGRVLYERSAATRPGRIPCHPALRYNLEIVRDYVLGCVEAAPA